MIALLTLILKSSSESNWSVLTVPVPVRSFRLFLGFALLKSTVMRSFWNSLSYSENFACFFSL